jgi:hypothetical protein
VRLDMRGNPNNHIRTRVNLNKKRFVVITVSNPTPIPVRDVKIKIRYPDAQGKALEIVKDVSNILSSGKSTTVETGIGPVEDPMTLRYMRVIVLKANVVENS